MFVIVLKSGERIEADVAESIDHTLEQQVTEFPTEVGMPVSDSLRGVPRRAGGRLLFSIYQQGHAGVSVDLARPSTIYDRLLALVDAKESFTLITRREVLENMVVERVSTADDSGTTASLPVDLTCKQINTVSSRLIQIPAKRRTAGLRARGRRRPANPTGTPDAAAAQRAKLREELLAEARRALGRP